MTHWQATATENRADLVADTGAAVLAKQQPSVVNTPALKDIDTIAGRSDTCRNLMFLAPLANGLPGQADSLLGCFFRQTEMCEG